MSTLQLRYSEAYDASLSGWTGALDEQYFAEHYDDWLREYVTPAQAYIAKAQQAWDQIDQRELIPLSHQHPLLQSAADLLKEHEPMLDYKDPLAALLTL